MTRGKKNSGNGNNEGIDVNWYWLFPRVSLQANVPPYFNIDQNSLPKSEANAKTMLPTDPNAQTRMQRRLVQHLLSLGGS